MARQARQARQARRWRGRGAVALGWRLGGCGPAARWSLGLLHAAAARGLRDISRAASGTVSRPGGAQGGGGGGGGQGRSGREQREAWGEGHNTRDTLGVSAGRALYVPPPSIILSGDTSGAPRLRPMSAVGPFAGSRAVLRPPRFLFSTPSSCTSFCLSFLSPPRSPTLSLPETAHHSLNDPAEDGARPRQALPLRLLKAPAAPAPSSTTTTSASRAPRAPSGAGFRRREAHDAGELRRAQSGGVTALESSLSTPTHGGSMVRGLDLAPRPVDTFLCVCVCARARARASACVEEVDVCTVEP